MAEQRSHPDHKTLGFLKETVGPKGWTDDPALMAPYLREWRDRWQGRTPLVLFPSSKDEVAAVVRICAETGTAIVPQGGNTGLVGGQIPTGPEVLLSLRRLNKIRSIDPHNDAITAEAGCILADIQTAAIDADRLFPLSLASEGSAQLGGLISTNAGGTAVLRYGNMRDLVLGLEVVTPDGRIWNGLRGLRKDNTGYDLKQLYIGAEGTLGVITAAVCKLFPAAASSQTALVAIPDVQSAIELLAPSKDKSGNTVTAFELMPRTGLEFVLRHGTFRRDPFAQSHDWYVLIELSSPGDRSLRPLIETLLTSALERDLVKDAVIAESEAQRADLWALRTQMSEAQKPEGGSLKHDISVPVSAMAEFIASATAAVEKALPGIRPVPFGHVGDGNVHFNLSQPTAMDKQAFLNRRDEIAALVHRIAVDLGGSISAEHGLGVAKCQEITEYKNAVEMDLMRSVKRALDPSNLMNPGKLVNSD